MRLRLTAIFAMITIGLGAAPSEAPADSVRIVSGGPSGKGNRARVLSSLQNAAGALAVCWRGKHSGAVTVALTVGPRGQVISSKQKTRGPAGQCVAGVLAVQKLAAVGSRYALSASFSAASSSAAGKNGIQAALGRHRGKLEACGKRAGDARWAGGRVTLRFLVRPDGRILEPEVASSQLGEASVERCLLDTVKKLRLARGLTAKTVSYSLVLRVPGRATKANSAPGGPARSPGLQPQKDGPLSGRAISAVMNRRQSDFSACYDKQARRNRKLAGRVVLRFTVRGDGTVRNVKIRETTLKNARVESCMVKVGKTLRFPAEPGRKPTRVFYPFAFASK